MGASMLPVSAPALAPLLAARSAQHVASAASAVAASPDWLLPRSDIATPNSFSASASSGGCCEGVAVRGSQHKRTQHHSSVGDCSTH